MSARNLNLKPESRLPLDRCSGAVRWSIGKPDACLAANENIGRCPGRKAGRDDRSQQPTLACVRLKANGATAIRKLSKLISWAPGRTNSRLARQ